MDDEVIDVLREIRDEVKATNSRLDGTNSHLQSLEGRFGSFERRFGSFEGRFGSLDEHLGSLDEHLGSLDEHLGSLEGRLDITNSHLESVEGRMDFLNRRVSKGFEDLYAHIDAHSERLELLTRRQTDSELRLATEVLTLADTNRQIRDLLSTKLDDHSMILNHEERIRSIEDRIGDHDRE